MYKYFIFLFALTSWLGSAQINIGGLYDANGFNFNGEYNPLTYQADFIVKLNGDVDVFEDGVYYDKNLEPHIARIRFRLDAIQIESLDSKTIKFKPDDINAFTLGTDSFMVTNSIEVNGNIKSKAIILHYITNIGGITFGKEYKGTKQGKSYVISNETYYAKKDKEDVWHELTKATLKKRGSEHFGKDSTLFSQIKQRKKDETDIIDVSVKPLGISVWYSEEYFGTSMQDKSIMELIKTVEFDFKAASNEKVYFSKNWKELQKGKVSDHFAYFKNYGFDKKAIEYYINDTLRYKAEFKSVYPLLPIGDFTSYYPNGKVKSIYNFSNFGL